MGCHRLEVCMRLSQLELPDQHCAGRACPLLTLLLVIGTASLAATHTVLHKPFVWPA